MNSITEEERIEDLGSVGLNRERRKRHQEADRERLDTGLGQTRQQLDDLQVWREIED